MARAINTRCRAHVLSASAHVTAKTVDMIVRSDLHARDAIPLSHGALISKKKTRRRKENMTTMKMNSAPDGRRANTRVKVESYRVVWPESEVNGRSGRERDIAGAQVVGTDSTINDVRHWCRAFGVECVCVTRSGGRIVVDRNGGTEHLGTGTDSA